MDNNYSKKRIGFDLDNTLIDYSLSCIKYSEFSELPKIGKTTDLKQHLNKIDPTTKTWNKAQSWIYTKGLSFAKISDGAEELLAWLQSKHYDISIHSHKSEKTPEYSGSLDLRTPMKSWIQSSNLITYLDFDRDIFFYETQDFKVEGISDANLDIFVDDLMAVFNHPRFPGNVVPLLIGNTNPEKTEFEQFSNFFELKRWIEEHDAKTA